MEILTIVISALLSLVSPLGFIVDQQLEKTIAAQVETAEEIEVRLDNAPSYQIIGGKIQKLRIASRGIWLSPDFRIDTLELETDQINLDWQSLQNNGTRSLPQALREPLQGGIHLQIKEKDLNRLLQSTSVVKEIENLVNRLIASRGGIQAPSYELLSLGIDLLANNRLKIEVELRQKGMETQPSSSFNLMLEAGIMMVNGRKLELKEPAGKVNDRALSTFLLEGFAQGISQRLDLGVLEERGITARLLQLEVDNEQIKIAGFIRIE